MKPIVLWLAGILALIVLLVVGGGFRGPMAYAVTGAMIVALVVGFIIFKRR